jgi:hypothetical protein
LIGRSLRAVVDRGALGESTITRWMNSRSISVKLNYRDRDLPSLMAEAQKSIAEKVSFDPKAGRDLHIAIRNNYPSIQNYVLEASGPGLTFLPERSEVSIAATAEREISVRVFSDDSRSALRQATIRVTGAAQLDQPIELLPIPRGDVATTPEVAAEGRT